MSVHVPSAEAMQDIYTRLFGWWVKYMQADPIHRNRMEHEAQQATRKKTGASINGKSENNKCVLLIVCEWKMSESFLNCGGVSVLASP